MRAYGTRVVWLVSSIIGHLTVSNRRLGYGNVMRREDLRVTQPWDDLNDCVVAACKAATPAPASLQPTPAAAPAPAPAPSAASSSRSMVVLPSVAVSIYSAHCFGEKEPGFRPGPRHHASERGRVSFTPMWPYYP